MKKSRIQYLSLLVMISFVFSAAPTSIAPASGQQNVETNFELWVMTNAGNRQREAMALYTKQALAPLGIDVKVVAKPFGQFVGDLLHQTTGHPFDIGIVAFTGGAGISEFGWAYHSTTTSFGDIMYQLNDPTWQAHQLVDAGVATADIDSLIESIDFELNLTKRQELTDQFAELYMDKLLYDLPTITPDVRESMHRGYGGPNNELWEARRGAMGSRAMGASWSDMPNSVANLRDGNATELRIQHVPPNQVTFDPFQVFDTATGIITDFMTANLLSFDFDRIIPHPGVAYNYLLGDLVDYDEDNNASTPVTTTEFANHTWFLHQNSMWPATTDSSGNAIAAEPVDADDYLFLHEMMKMTNVVVNGQDIFAPVIHSEIRTTVTADDTLLVYVDPAQRTPTDSFSYSAWPPLPRHILGGTLTFTNASGTWSDTAAGLDALGINPQLTDEWMHWSSLAGHSLNGPYEIETLQLGEFYEYSARADWYYPNEWDASAVPSVLGGVFAPHLNQANPDAYFWAYNGDETSKTKPITQGVEQLTVILIEDPNARLIAFEAGRFDIFGSSGEGALVVKQHEDNPDMVQKQRIPPSGPRIFVFNLLHPDVQKINVRRAISRAVDMDVLLDIYDGFGFKNWSPVWLSDCGGGGCYKSFEFDQGIELAKDFMRLEGYEIADSIDTEVNVPIGTATSQVSQAGQVVENIVQEALGSEYLIFISGFALLTFATLRRRRR